MYFANRAQAGRMLASRIIPKYRYENCVVLALDDGGVVVGAEIAVQLHCALTMLTSSEINLPLEPIALAGITEGGDFSYNHQYTPSELEEMVSENRSFIDEEKIRKMQQMTHIVGKVGTVNKRILKSHDVIVVSDGLKSTFAIDLVSEFLKPVKINKIIFAVVMASVQVIDKMHVMGDDLYIINIIDEFLDPSHYYDSNTIPDHKAIIDIIEQIV